MENRKREGEGFSLPPQKVCLLFSPFRENYKSTVLLFVEIMTVVEQAMFLWVFAAFSYIIIKIYNAMSKLEAF